MWVVKYEPKTTSKLALHSKKIQEVVSWCDVAHTNEILLLLGPPGCGKSTCMNVIPNLQLLTWNSDDVQSFNDFVLRASRYQDFENSGIDTKKILLIESLPNNFYDEPAKFHDILTIYKSVGRHPLVIILTDNSSLKYSQHWLLPKSVQQKLNIKIISFNPIAQTQMKKALMHIINSEHFSKVKEKRLQEIVSDIYNKSGGDIRSAINNLQVLLKGSSTMCNDMDMTKDATLFIFRALGKILYCKRETDKTKIEMYEKNLSTLSRCSKHNQRAPLLFCPEDVYEQCGLGHSTFVNYLHENYPDFIEDIHHTTSICDSFSQADTVTGQWCPENVVQSGDISVSVTTRAMAFYNQSRSKNTWRPLRKSPLPDLHKTVSQLQAEVMDLIECDPTLLRPLSIVSMKSAFLDNLPFCGIIKRRSSTSKMCRDLMERLRFSKRRNCGGQSLEDNMAVEGADGDNGGGGGGGVKRRVRDELWAVCDDDNEENVVIDMDE